jgi:hypothetical protein
MSSVPKMPRVGPCEAEHVHLDHLRDVLKKVAGLRHDQQVEQRQPLIHAIDPRDVEDKGGDPREHARRAGRPEGPALKQSEAQTSQ